MTRREPRSFYLMMAMVILSIVAGYALAGWLTADAHSASAPPAPTGLHLVN